MYVAEKDLEKLGRYWVSGGDVRGAGFGEESAARIVALPGYPFASSRVASPRGPLDDGRRRETNGLASSTKDREVTHEPG